MLCCIRRKVNQHSSSDDSLLAPCCDCQVEFQQESELSDYRVFQSYQSVSLESPSSSLHYKTPHRHIRNAGSHPIANSSAY